MNKAKKPTQDPVASSGERERIATLYGGSLTLRRNGAHRYFANDVPCDVSMSAVEKVMDAPQLNAWKLREALARVRRAFPPGTVMTEELSAMIEKLGTEAPDKKRDEAADQGLALHDELEQWTQGYLGALGSFPVTKASVDKLIEKLADALYPQEALSAVLQMGDYLIANKAEILSAEQLIYSKKMKLPGTLDLRLRLNGHLAIGDYKVRSGVYENTRIQLTLEQAAASEEDGLKYQDRVVFLIQRKNGKFTGTFEPILFDDYRGDLKAATSALKLVRWKKRFEKKWQK